MKIGIGKQEESIAAIVRVLSIPGMQIRPRFARPKSKAPRCEQRGAQA
ncbi:hypothetical protein WJ542_02485 [Paraburkholderia sp. B3]